jgi:hypothetical protein
MLPESRNQVSAGTAAKREKQIPTALDMLTASVEQVIGSFLALQGDINSVLAPRTPTEREEATEPDKNPRCNIAEAIETQIARLNILANDIDETAQRIEL